MSESSGAVYSTDSTHRKALPECYWQWTQRSFLQALTSEHGTSAARVWSTSPEDAVQELKILEYRSS